MNKRKKRMAGVLAAAAAALIMTGCTAQTGNTAAAETASAKTAVSGNFETAEEGRITVDGEGKQSVTPDIAQIRMSVVTNGENGESAEEIKGQNAQEVNRVTEYLQSAGLEKTSIRTENVYFSPNYDWSGEVRRITGYTMQTELQVSDIPIDEVGAVMDGAVKNGVNDISSVQYLSSRYDETYSEALKLAVQNAREKAEVLAASSGVTLGATVTLVEYGSDTSARYTESSMMLEASRDMGNTASGSSVNIEPGELDITARVGVTFAIQK